MLNRKEIDKKIMDYRIMKSPQSNVPGRSIISNNCTATENVSSFFDIHLKTIIPTTTDISKDTRDFLVIPQIIHYWLHLM